MGAATSIEIDGSQAAILNTTDATLGTTFTANTIVNLPLNGLDFSAVTLYLPGSAGGQYPNTEPDCDVRRHASHR